MGCPATTLPDSASLPEKTEKTKTKKKKKKKKKKSGNCGTKKIHKVKK